MLGRDRAAKLIIGAAIAGREGILVAPVNSPSSRVCQQTRPTWHMRAFLKRYAMQIVFDIGIVLCHHVFIPVGTTFERKGHFMIIGYGRTSTIEQVAGLEAQIRDLEAAGAEKLFRENVSSVAPRNSKRQSSLRAKAIP
jgi:hypothetical protein